MPTAVAEAYQVLGLPPGSTPATVQARYKQLARVFHPDRFHSKSEKSFAEAEMKKLNTARDTIIQYWHRQNASAQAEAAPSPHPPTPAPDKNQDRVLTLLLALLDEWNKGLSKKYPLKKTLDQLGEPLKISRETKKRRAWILLIVLILLESALSHCFKSESKAGFPSQQYRIQEIESPTQAHIKRSENSQQKQETLQSSLKERHYFLKLAVERELQAIQWNRTSLSQVQAALCKRPLDRQEERLLEGLARLHSKNLHFAEEQLALNQRDLQVVEQSLANAP